jgi:hypothetical protein
MATYTITGIATFSNQNNRNSARDRVDTALSSFTYTGVPTTFAAGVDNPTNTTMTVSLEVITEDDNLVRDIRRAVYDAWTVSNRPTPCWLSSNKIS